MRPRVLILAMAALFVVNANPFTNLSRACTKPPPEPEPKPVWLTRVSATKVVITVSELTKSAPPGAPADGCACAIRNLASVTSIDGVQFEYANGNPIPNEQWSWGSAPAAGGAWAAAAGGGSWTAFKGCNCAGVPTGAKFNIRFLATVPEATLTNTIQAELLAAPSILGTDTTNDLNVTGSPSNGSHQAFWNVSVVEQHALPHFMTINIFEQDVFGDSGPVDTVALGIGTGPFLYEAIPAGEDLDGMLTEDLPVGLSINPNTGAISGTPTICEIRHVACILTDPKSGLPWDILWWKIIIDDGTIPHFAEKHTLVTAEPVDTGPIDTSQFDPPGPYGFEVVPAGQIFRGIQTDSMPMGLSIDSDTGAVSGGAKWPGQYHVLCVVTRKGTWEVVAFLWWEFNIEGDHIPAVSEWGLVVTTLLMLTAGTIVLMRRRTVAA